MKLEFLNRFSKNTQISDFMKILPVGAKFSIRTDGRTDEQTDDEGNSRFYQFCQRA